ncbi:MAG: hypothetical protein A2736_02395 [Candidatus Yanofskybacteria bacterium RIFCSPHIGHO2_01_FULL_41_27]|uniref:Uncharacterized protein n=1 Tax=Candidatus Yanofskybacteria bacterium RIFCSPHIGHO2_01_FULL_41_27 TaxID=1802662 RepID=A0A1F8EG94_9BACT|nr:MAG: hypothetical protein A2736_02395 [Candidatus Yanofskybacteria bacterium RIFCSPHIGHO2_01_FULL_41_27]
MKETGRGCGSFGIYGARRGKAKVHAEELRRESPASERQSASHRFQRGPAKGGGRNLRRAQKVATPLSSYYFGYPASTYPSHFMNFVV